MICGGNHVTSRNSSNACLQINPDASNPQWTIVDAMPNPRLMPDAVLLPGDLEILHLDGTVLMVNGLTNGQAGGNQGQVMYANGPVYATDLLNPSAPSGSRWSTVGTATNKRLYHSGALLLETGHVITTGSEMDNYDDFYGANPDPNCYPTGANICTSPFNYNIERFTPPYMQKGSGPVVTGFPVNATHGSLIQINVASSANVGRVSFIRTSTVT